MIKFDFESLYNKQIKYQKRVLEKENNEDKNLPRDDVHWFSYHINGIVEALGEILKADKRWKTHRNSTFDAENKKVEIADLFITAMNIAMYSGLDYDELSKAINDKIESNFEELKLAEK